MRGLKPDISVLISENRLTHPLKGSFRLSHKIKQETPKEGDSERMCMYYIYIQKIKLLPFLEKVDIKGVLLLKVI